MYALVSPWPPQLNGIADYAGELARAGGEPVRLVTEALRPDLSDAIAVPTRPRDFLADAGGAALYHVGNNRQHAFIAPLFLAKPGVVVLHDPTLRHLAEKIEPTLPGFLREQIGPRHADAMTRYWRGAGPSLADHLQFPCLGWLRGAKAIVVHSRFVKRLVEQELPETPVRVVPHFAYRSATGWPPDPKLRTATRARLGLGRTDFVVAAFGFVARNKQYESVIRAIGSLPPRLRKRTRFVVAGAADAGDYDFAAVVERHRADFVELRGEVGLDEAMDLLASADVVANLRYPTFGESSGAVARAFGAGAATIVSDGGAFSELPDGACFKVPYRRDVSAELADIFGAIAEEPERAAEVGAAALDHARRAISPAICAARIREIMLS